MKFEIDDKTGMIAVDENGFILSSDDENTEVIWARSSELEKILQAVKKTQEKLVNIQIQEIQDSKNTIGMPKGFAQLQEHEKQVIEKIIQQLPNQMMTFRDNEHVRTVYFTPTDYEKIEQNQKIVDGVIKFMASKELPSFTQAYKKLSAIMEGKDIKDLS